MGQDYHILECNMVSVSKLVAFPKKLYQEKEEVYKSLFNVVGELKGINQEDFSRIIPLNHELILGLGVNTIGRISSPQRTKEALETPLGEICDQFQGSFNKQRLVLENVVSDAYMSYEGLNGDIYILRGKSMKANPYEDFSALFFVSPEEKSFRLENNHLFLNGAQIDYPFHFDNLLRVNTIKSELMFCKVGNAKITRKDLVNPNNYYPSGNNSINLGDSTLQGPWILLQKTHFTNEDIKQYKDKKRINRREFFNTRP